MTEILNIFTEPDPIEKKPPLLTPVRYTLVNIEPSLEYTETTEWTTTNDFTTTSEWTTTSEYTETSVYTVTSVYTTSSKYTLTKIEHSSSIIKPTPVITPVPTVITTLPPNPNPNPQPKPIPKCGLYEIWAVESNCGNYCQNLCCKNCCIVNKQANFRCTCIHGYARNLIGKCIKIDDPECVKQTLRTRDCKKFDCGTVFPVKISKRPTIIEF